MTLDAVLTRIDADLEPALARLFALLRIPSISTDPAHAGDVRAAADWLRDDLASMGFAAAVHDTPGHPMVVGQMDGPGPHVLFYGHYDVQPVDPLSLVGPRALRSGAGRNAQRPRDPRARCGR
jgi:acetylornithine deacetylase/succinyl-diaminopimelate desuccinylase-like protein